MSRRLLGLVAGLCAGACAVSTPAADAGDYVPVRACVISGNRCASRGGGIYFHYTTGRVEQCVIDRNTADQDGGGVYAGAGVQIRDCLISGNRATNDGYGGGLYLVAIGISNGMVSACTIVGNEASYGGGVALNGLSNSVWDCIVVSNAASAGSNDLYYATGEQQSSFRYCCAAALLPQSGNITNDPGFIGFASGNYRIDANSPCLDAGTNLAWMFAAKDLDGTNNRICRGWADIGAYEYSAGVLGCTFTADRTWSLAPSTNIFTAMLDGTNLDGLGYAWDFNGDSAPDLSGSDLGVVTAVYAAAGYYSPALTVTNAIGERATVTNADSIKVSPITYYVATNGGAVWPYADGWTSASPDLPRVVAMGDDQDTVLVSNGTYTLTGQVSILNGFTVRGFTGNRADVIIDGNYPALTNRCFYLNHSNATLAGLTITNGRTSPTDPHGAGVYIASLGGLVTNCWIQGNYAATNGGGIYVNTATGFVRNVVVNSNTAFLWGGGVYLNYGGRLLDSRIVSNRVAGGSLSRGAGVAVTGAGLVTNCDISWNNAGSGSAGGVNLYSSGGQVWNCAINSNRANYGGGVCFYRGGAVYSSVISSNYANYRGGGLILQSAGLARNCLITRNSAASASHGGGGIFLQAETAYTNTIAACTIVNNSAYRGGGIALQNGWAKITNQVVDCIIYTNVATSGTDADLWDYDGSNAAAINFCCAASTNGFAGISNVTVDPLFLDLAGGNYRLASGSPCVNAGTNMPWMLPPVAGSVDLDGLTRILYETVDLGAYEQGFFDPALATPADVQASDGGYDDQVLVTWSTNACTNAASYPIYRCGTADPAAATMIAVAPAPPYADTSAITLSNYYYWVQASNIYSVSLLSLSNTGYRNLAPPGSVSASDGDYTDKIQVTWLANADATGYSVWRAVNGEAPAASSNIGATTEIFFDDPTAIPGTNYAYWVQATKGAFVSALSASNTGCRGLSPPTGIQASDGAYTDKIQVDWAGNTNASGYAIWRSLNSDANTAVKLFDTSDLSYADISAIPGTSYWYWVQATNAFNASALSTSNAGYRLLTPPDVVQASDGVYVDKVRVTWAGNTNATGYEIWRAVNDPLSSITNKLGETSGISYDDVTAVPGTNYTYWVKATNAIAVSALSGSNTGYRALAAPDDISASDGAYLNKVQVDWAINTNASGYAIWRSLSADTNTAALIAGTLVHPYADTSAIPGTSYWYWVQATNAIGASALSMSNAGYRALSPPGSVQASDGAYADKIQVDWPVNTNASGYAIWRSIAADTNAATVLGASPAPPYNDGSAIPGTSYWYWVQATNAIGASAWSMSNAGYRALSPPGSVQASDGAYTDKIQVDWPVNTNASGYAIWRSIAADTNAATVLGASPAPPYNDGSAIPGTSYWYWVQATNAIGSSAWSMSNAGYRALSPPGSVQASDGAYVDKVLVTWDVNTNATGYAVWRSLNADANTAVKLFDTSDLSYADISAIPGTSYWYWVQATNAIGASAWSMSNAGYRALSPPGSVQASDGAYVDTVLVTWDVNTNASGYAIWRSIAADTNAATLLSASPAPPYNDGSAIPGTSYWYWVQSTNAIGASAWSMSNAGYRALSPPGSVQASDGAYVDKILVTWEVNTNATGYAVWRSLSAATNTAALLAGVAGGGTTNYDDISAIPGSVYYYWLKATNAVAIGEFSASNTGFRALSPPSGGAASQGTYTNKIRLSWIAATGAVNYAIYRNTVNDLDTAAQLGAQPAGSPYDDSAILPKTDYYYWLKAQCAVSTSAFSAVAFGYTDRAPPQPDPLTWQTPPAAGSTAAVWMAATPVTDDNPPFRYQFTNATVGLASDWQATTAWTNTGLRVNERYEYRARAMDGAANTTGWSVVASVFTLAKPPLAPLAGQAGWRSIRIALNAANTGSLYNADGNPSNTEYTIGLCANAGVTNYVDEAGALTSAPVWRPIAGWHGTNGVVVSNLDPQATNTLRAQARNGDGVPTAWSSISNPAFAAPLQWRALAQTNDGSGRAIIDAGVFSLDGNDVRLRVAYGAAAAPTNAAVLAPVVQAAYGAPVVRNDQPWQIGSISTTNRNNRVVACWETRATTGRWSLADSATSVWVCLTLNDPAAGYTSAGVMTNIQVDNRRPRVTLTSSASEPTADWPIAVTATFDEAVLDFTVAGITASNAVVLNFTGGGANYTFDLAPVGTGLITVAIVSNAAHDALGNGNTPAGFSRTWQLGIPTGITVSQGDFTDKIQLMWNAVSDATGYDVYRHTLNDPATSGLLASNWIASVYDDSAAAPGTLYYYWIKARKAGGTSAFSGSSAGYRMLAAPANVQASDGTYLDKVQVSWETHTNASGYAIYRSLTADTNAAVRIADTSASPYADTAALPGTSYWYWVQAANSVCGSAFSAADSGYLGLATPAGVAASDGLYTDKIGVEWNPVAGAAGYEVWRNTSANPVTATIMRRLTSATCEDPGATSEVTYYYWVKATNAVVSSALSGPDAGWQRKASVLINGNNGGADYDGDGRTDPAVYQPTSGVWVVWLSAAGYGPVSVTLGGVGQTAVPADYDGDGKADPAVYMPATGTWQVLLSGGGYTMASIVLGGTDLTAAPADYDGDGKADPAVYRTNGQWQVLLSGSGYATVSAVLGGAGYLPAPADYDGDAKADPAVYGILDGTLVVMLSAGGYAPVSADIGGTGYEAVPVDFDGDAKADPAAYAAGTGAWLIMLSGGGYQAVPLMLGGSGFSAVPSDFDGDAKADPAVYQEASGTWQVLLSASGYAPISVHFSGP